MTKTMTKKKEQVPEVKTQFKAEVQEEVVESNPYVETNTQMKAEAQEEVVVSNPNVETKKQMKDEAQEEVVVSNPYVETLWKQYEQTLDQARKLRESSEEAYLKSVKDVIKFNKEFRKSISDLYTESRKTSREIVKGLSSNFAKIDELKQISDQQIMQVEEISEGLEKLAITPIKFTVDLIERLEKNVEESSETYVRYSRERRKVWGKVTNEYLKIAKNNHKMLVNRLEESVKLLVSTNRK
ncbi:hypothetical protein ACIFOT_04595 [Neobacillus sp. NRS-1170]|uniref:hypothetical protein n=1 Tax=Neobacillus sp. NRS-1170 TaxID=3233898 RepID=UPI003D27D34D